MGDSSQGSGEADTGAVQGSSGSDEAWRVSTLKLGIGYHQRNALDFASACYSGVLAVFPDDPEATQLMGTLHLKTKEYQSAYYWLVKAAKALPNVPHVALNLALACRGLERFSEALDSCSRYLTRVPDDTRAWLIHAGLCIDLCLKEQALKSCGEAIKRGRDDLLVWEHVADIHRELGDPDDAQKIYRWILKKWPDAHDARLNLGILQLNAGNLSEGWVNYEARLLAQRGTGLYRRATAADST